MDTSQNATNGHNRLVRTGTANGSGTRRSRIPLRIGSSLSSLRSPPPPPDAMTTSASENALQRQSISPTRCRTSKIPRLTPPSSPTLRSMVPLTNGNRNYRTNGRPVTPVGTNGLQHTHEKVNGNHENGNRYNEDHNRNQLRETDNGVANNVDSLEEGSDQEFEELEKELGIVSVVASDEPGNDDDASSSSTVCNEEDSDSVSSELMDLHEGVPMICKVDDIPEEEECYERGNNEVEDDSGIVCEDTSVLICENAIKDVSELELSICSSDGFDESLDCDSRISSAVETTDVVHTEVAEFHEETDTDHRDSRWISEVENDNSLTDKQKGKTVVQKEEYGDNPDVLDILTHIKTMSRHQYAPDVVPCVEGDMVSDHYLRHPSPDVGATIEKSEMSLNDFALPVERDIEKSERSWSVPSSSSSKEVSSLEARRENSSRTETILATSNMLRACIGRSPIPTLATTTSSKFPTTFNVTTSNVASSFMPKYKKLSVQDKKKEEEEDGQLLMTLAPEEVNDMDILERMMNAASSYDQRRRIRSQIRLLKKKEDDGRRSRRQFDSTFSISPIGGAVNSSSVCLSSRSTEGVVSGKISSDSIWRTIDSLVASSLNGGLDVKNDENEAEIIKEKDFGSSSSSSSSKPPSSETIIIMGDWVDGVNLSDINDELKLHEMLDSCPDYEDRKKVRSRLKDVIAHNRAQREEMIRRREDEREETIRARLRDANEQKKRTMAMYDAMAKSAPAGGNKTLDVNILREDVDCKENRCGDLSDYKSMPSSSIARQSVPRCSNGTVAVGLDSYVTSSLSETFTVTSNSMEFCSATSDRIVSFSYGRGSGHSTPTRIEPVGGPKVDLVEQAIRERQKEADDRKKRILTAFDNAAKSGPAGATRFIDFEAVKPSDVVNYDPNPTKYSSTFSMKGGVPQACPVGTPHFQRRPESEAPYDPVEESIRKRKKEADDRKRRTLAAYDTAARSRPAGEPVSIYIPYDDDVAPVIEVAKRISPKEKFQQLDSAVAPKGAVTLPSTTAARPAGAGIARSPTAIKEMLLNWCKSKTREYESVSIDNFSTSWNDGIAFCALIHHFYPDAFDFASLNPKNRRYNFDLAFRTAEEKGDVAPLLDTDDMVMMKKPDWKCVFTYVQSLYRRFHNVD